MREAKGGGCRAEWGCRAHRHRNTACPRPAWPYIAGAKLSWGCRRAACSAGVNITALLASNETFDLGRAHWDLIVATYAPFPLTAADYVRWLGGSLTPCGGVVESFASEANTTGRRPVDIAPTDLRRAFDSFRIRYFEDAVAMPDWTREKTRLVRLFAEYRA